MTNELQQAMEAKAAAARALAEAERNVREIALANYNVARDAAVAAGVKLGPTPRRFKPLNIKQSQAMKSAWASKTPEQRAEWQQRAQAARRASRSSAEAVN